MDTVKQVPVEEGLTDVDVRRFVVDGVAKEVEGREWEVLAVGSGDVIPWFTVELSPSPGGVVALLPTEAMVTGGKGLPVGDGVAITPSVGCPWVGAVGVS